MNIGLYFGSFNPIHIGHLAIANFIVEYTKLDKIWFVISPHNPLKKKQTLLNDYHRLDLVHAAIVNDNRFMASDIEFRMPQPSYTTNTLAYLKEKYPGKSFALIMGSDGLRTFHRWKNHEVITENYTRYVYPRIGEEKEYILSHPNVELVDAPRIEISSSFIRNAIKEKKDVRHFLPPNVFELIDKQGFYL